jgi:hypothetical protein
MEETIQRRKNKSNVPLKFNVLENYTTIKNIVLIDSEVKNYMDFYNNCNDITFPIIYNKSSNINDLQNVLKNFTNIDRIAFVFDEQYLFGTKIFISSNPFFTDNDLQVSNINELSTGFKFVIDEITRLNIKNIDYLACNSLNYQKWKEYYNKLTSLANVIVSASDNKTGNVKYGGDWILENTGFDIKNIYFTDVILNYSSTLNATTITANSSIEFFDVSGNFSYKVDNGATNSLDMSIDFPITLQCDSSNNLINVTISSNITFTTNSQYFICGNDNIVIDGLNNTINTNGIENYPGIIANGIGSIDVNWNLTVTNAYENITIQNIIHNDISNLSSLNYIDDYASAGWICQYYFGYLKIDDSNNALCEIKNCSSNGNLNITINDSGGCIVGDYSTINAYNCNSTGLIVDFGGGIVGCCAQYCNISNCHSTGNIGDNGGGIVGLGAINCNISNCYSTGNIGDKGGGIIGVYNFNNIVSKCYSTGNIGVGGGGIIGETTYGGIVTNCYSIGTINPRAGGIFGSYTNAANSYYNTNATNCYSFGSIGASGGGIYGSYSNYSATSSTCTATNCYSFGSIGASGGGIYGSYSNEGATTSSCTATNCYVVGTVATSGNDYFGSNKQNSTTSTNSYSENNGSWNDTNASLLINSNNYKSMSSNTPYLLTAFNTNFYNNVSSATIKTGSSTNLTFTGSGTNFYTNDTNVLIDSSGNMTTDASSNGLYVLNTNISPTNFYYGYNIIAFTIIVELLLSNICFLGDTSILTNVGLIPISKIDKNIHTINKKRIVAITRTITSDKYLVKFKKGSLKTNVPNIDTIMSKDHMVFHDYKLQKAKEYLKINKNVEIVKYNGETLYNILLENHDYVLINNMLCETLHPENMVAKIYRKINVVK